MKKFCIVCLFAILFMLYASSSFGMIGMDVVIGSLEKFANQIVANNQHTFETKLTYNETHYGGMTLDLEYGRVWAKDKTIVIGFAGSDKRFTARTVMTADPKFKFANGLHVGMDMKALKKALKLSNKEFNYYMKMDNGNIGDADDLGGAYRYEVICEKGKAAIIYSNFGALPASRTIINVVRQKRKELGFPCPKWEMWE